MSKLPRDYSSWVCVYVRVLHAWRLFLLLSAELRVGESHFSPPFVHPPHFCSSAQFFFFLKTPLLQVLSEQIDDAVPAL